MLEGWGESALRVVEEYMLKSVWLRRIRLVSRLLVSGAILSFVALAFFALLPSARLEAQVGSSSSAQALQSLLQGSGVSGTTGFNIGQQPANQNPLTFLPAVTNAPLLPPSRLEQILSQRAGVTLNQFGYDLVGTGQPVVVPQMGSVADSYILGPGDELAVSFRGQESSEYTVDVDRDGNISLPRISPINVSGRTMGEFRQLLASAVKRSYVSTQVYVSLTRLRQVSVIVAGDVFVPGTRLVTGLSTPLDAILLSGGIRKTGSLRNITLVRRGQRTSIDLYDLLTQRSGASNITLTDGDKIIVPPIGKTVAVAGWVRRPGIYELAPGTAGISASALLRLAGGLELRGRYRLAVARVLSDGSTNLEALVRNEGTIRDSEILFVQPAADQINSQATLSGGIPLAGNYSTRGATTLTEMLKAPGALGQNPYTLFGIISRRDPSTMLRTLIAITPIAVVRGDETMPLKTDDIVRVFSSDESRLMTAVVEEFKRRREAADEALRNPALADYSDQLANQQLSQSSSAATAAANASNAAKNAQGLSQTSTQSNPVVAPSGLPNTERQDIADLSVETLGDGGVLTNNPPANGYTTYASVPSMAAQPLPVSPGGSTASQIAAGQSSVPTAQTQQQGIPQPSYASSVLPGGAQQSPMNLPPNMQQQQIEPGQVPTNESAETFGQLARQLNIDPLVLVHFLIDRALTVDGAVHGPGTYFVGPHATLQDVVTAAGGAIRSADERSVELISTTIDPSTGSAHTANTLVALNDPAQAQQIVRPLDEIRLNKIDTVVDAGSVTLQGQVRYPGTYHFQRGERLSELLLRAGGLTDVAYPYGTVYLRKSAADTERQSYLRAARDLENQVAAGITVMGSDKTPPEALTQMQSFIAELRSTTPVGRITVAADPALLASNPADDILLEPGDVIYVPQRSSTVSVMGEVLQPGTFQDRANVSADDYIDRAGGYTQFANKSMTFVVYPDGTARQLDSSWLNFDSSAIPPGSTIVVPRDAAILDTRQIILDITGIFRDLAVGAASLAVIARN